MGDRGMASSPTSKRARHGAERTLDLNAGLPVEGEGREGDSNQERFKSDTAALTYRVISNDGDPKHMEMLITLKNIFARQLPKMPKEYIVRLVFDHRHRSMALCKGDKPIGGICYRPYFPQKFAEIAFCAVTATEQVKGFGTQLMNQLKQHVIQEGITHFLTYADNYAIGYFKKQGFSKTIGMPKDRWYGYIKDYDGGTLMECYIHPTVPYTCLGSVIAQQQRFVESKIFERVNLQISLSGLELFRKGERVTDIFAQVPGLSEHGWHPHNVAVDQRMGNDRERSALTKELMTIWNKVAGCDNAWPFRNPVDTAKIADYLEIVKDPIDLQTMRDRLEAGGFYKSHAMLQADMLRMCVNCKTYNAEGTAYFQAAVDIEAVIGEAFQNVPKV